MKIIDVASVPGVSEVLNSLTPEQRKAVEALIAAQNQPSVRGKKFRVVGLDSDGTGTAMLQVYGCGTRLDRSEATWLFEHAQEGLKFLADHPEIK